MCQVIQRSAKPFKVYMNITSYLYGPRRRINSHNCLGHVINLANIDVMDHITKIAAMETTTAI
ncbi:hypothetical protein L208DRAFT_1466589 [Tricholoma matsutake]|nr:hypothetical protein L208DRAFT_1466589 [Tricholoma matsutake 945]